jgi:stage II sporulation protein D
VRAATEAAVVVTLVGLTAACASGPAPRVETRPPAASTPAATATPQPSPTPTVVPTPPVAIEPQRPMPASAPSAPPPARMPSRDLEPPLVRILLERSRGRVELPQPGRAYRATHSGGAVWLWGPLEVAASAGREWQVGAYGEESAATAAADRLRQRLGTGVEVRSERTDERLTRVRVRWNGPEPPDATAILADLGFTGAFPVAGGGGVEVLAGAGGPLEAAGEVLLEPAGDYPTAVGGGRYRGRFRVRVVGDEILVVNELNFESYLRGVVPAEMGPVVFPEVEALKAQAVAARTYAVAHRGERAGEGYDLCATTACQVYEGVGVEHPLSDRAVAETAGLIAVYAGAPIDAMYASTCGGHTDDAALLFPDRAAPYLKGVPCAWERPLVLEGAGADGEWRSAAEAAEEVACTALGLSRETATPGAVLARVGASGLGPPGRLPDGADASRFAAALLATAGLGAAAEVVGQGATPVERLLALADLFEIELAPPPPEWANGWHLRAALAVLELAGVVARDRGEAVPRPEGVGIFPRKAAASEPLPSPLPLWERWGTSQRPVARAEVLPGTLLDRLRRGDQVLALTVARSGGGGDADRRSAWRFWARERTWSELADRIGVPDLVDLEVTARAESGRVVGLTAIGRSGARKELSGFPIRRALDLPDNLFAFHRLRRPDGVDVVRFLGRGWGHGVGLCQNGAYGLARAGMRFEQILGTYYTGIELARWEGETR